MAAGDITGVINSFRFEGPGNTAHHPRIFNVCDDIVGIAYCNNNRPWLRTIRVQSDGTITGSIDAVNLDTTIIDNGSMRSCHIHNGIYGVVYRRSNNTGWIRTAEINTDGIVSGPLSHYQFESGIALFPSVCKLSDNIVVVVYYDGNLQIKTIGINTNGAITGIIDSHTGPYIHVPNVMHLNGDIFVITGMSSDSHFITLTSHITSSGTISGITDTYNAGHYNAKHDTGILKLSNNIVASTRSRTPCVLMTSYINDSGFITGDVSHHDVSNDVLSSYLTHIHGNAYAALYSQYSRDCYIQTIGIDTNGTIDGTIDEHLITQDAYGSTMCYLTRDIYVVANRGASDYGYIHTVGIDTPSGTVASPRFTGGMCHRWMR